MRIGKWTATSPYRFGDVLQISCDGNYDADIVISRTSTGVVYVRGPEAPLAVREPGASAPRQPRLLDRVRDALRARHGSRRTEKSYVAWIRRYILFHSKRHPAEMGAECAPFSGSSTGPRG